MEEFEDNYCSHIKGEIVGSPFPKRCPYCRLRFNDRQSYLKKTNPNDKKPLLDYKINDKYVVKEFRDCFRCDFTMSVKFKDRRDQSEEGDRRRAKYTELYEKYIASGLDKEQARNQTLEIIRGTM